MEGVQCGVSMQIFIDELLLQNGNKMSHLRQNKGSILPAASQLQSNRSIFLKFIYLFLSVAAFLHFLSFVSIFIYLFLARDFFINS